MQTEKAMESEVTDEPKIWTMMKWKKTKKKRKKKKKGDEKSDEEEEEEEEEVTDDAALDAVDVVHISKYRMQRRVQRGGPVVDLEAGVVKDRKLTDPAFIVIFSLCMCGMV